MMINDGPEKSPTIIVVQDGDKKTRQKRDKGRNTRSSALPGVARPERRLPLRTLGAGLGAAALVGALAASPLPGQSVVADNELCYTNRFCKSLLPSDQPPQRVESTGSLNTVYGTQVQGVATFVIDTTRIRVPCQGKEVKKDGTCKKPAKSPTTPGVAIGIDFSNEKLLAVVGTTIDAKSGKPKPAQSPESITVAAYLAQLSKDECLRDMSQVVKEVQGHQEHILDNTAGATQSMLDAQNPYQLQLDGEPVDPNQDVFTVYYALSGDLKKPETIRYASPLDSNAKFAPVACG